MIIGKTMVKTRYNPQCPNCFEKGRVTKKIDGKFSVYFCTNCYNGFTYPTPLNIKDYYQSSYWNSSNLLGKIKNTFFKIFQQRRINWVTETLPKGSILDVGSGEGCFGKSLPKRYTVTNIEPLFSKVINKSVIKTDFLKWQTPLKFDAVCFWESLEHTPLPKSYLSKAFNLLKKGGIIFIEFPRHESLESKLFGKNWYHMDTPRHLSHLTDNGIKYLLNTVGFAGITLKSVPSFDYTPWGFTASVLNCFGINLTDKLKDKQNILIFLMTTPLVFVSALIEVFFIIINQSPIGLATARKNE